MLKLIKEDSNNSDKENTIVSKVHSIEVPIRIEGVDYEIPEDCIDSTNLRKLLDKYESYINDNLDIEDENYQILLNNDIEIIEDVIIINNLLKLGMVSIPEDLVESEVKSIISDYLTSSYMSPYEDLVITVNAEQYNQIYSEEISNGEVKPMHSSEETKKLSVNMELQLELEKIKIM